MLAQSGLLALSKRKAPASVGRGCMCLYCSAIVDSRTMVAAANSTALSRDYAAGLGMLMLPRVQAISVGKSELPLPIELHYLRCKAVGYDKGCSQPLQKHRPFSYGWSGRWSLLVKSAVGQKRSSGMANPVASGAGHR